MAGTMTELMPASETTLHMKGPKMAMPLPQAPKTKAKLRIDPQRALEPARKKLGTVEAQRIMACLDDCIRRSEILAILPYVMENGDRFSTMLGAELTQLIKEHTVLVASFDELRESAAQTDDEARREGIVHQLGLLAKQMQASCKNILRGFSHNMQAMTQILKERQRSMESGEIISEMSELRDIVMNKLLTTPLEEVDRTEYLREISQRERHNAGIIEKLETELNAALEDKEAEIRKKNDVIRRLQGDLHQIEKFSDEHIRRTKSEAEKQEAADLKNSEGRRAKLGAEIVSLKAQLASLTAEHRESELALRTRKFKMETEVEGWIQKYDGDMGERQAEYEDIDTVYTEEKSQLTELEEKFTVLEAEYTAIMEERRVAREKREAEMRELQASVAAATTIQAYWRSFKVRKALKGKKSKKGKKGKKGKA